MMNQNMMDIRMDERVEDIVNEMCKEIRISKGEKSERFLELERIYLMNKQFTEGFDFSEYDQRISRVFGGKVV
ncbi:hypothetical protein GOV13_01465 [Candidatus Pacearchaeota archaeon]|nr:hypothetical protein [Candidatus Pacearchaeota archaeon]